MQEPTEITEARKILKKHMGQVFHHMRECSNPPQELTRAEGNLKGWDLALKAANAISVDSLDDLPMRGCCMDRLKKVHSEILELTKEKP